MCLLKSSFKRFVDFLRGLCDVICLKRPTQKQEGSIYTAIFRHHNFPLICTSSDEEQMGSFMRREKYIQNCI